MLQILSAEWCAPCKQLKNQLNEAGITFEVIDIDSNKDHKLVLKAKEEGRTYVPQVYYEGDIIPHQRDMIGVIKSKYEQ